jgi:protein-tyrosine kinase
MPRSTSEAKLVTHINPGSVISESYWRLRANIQFSNIDRPLKTLMAASAQSGEGKSTTISNLAVTYAQEGKKTLIIDSDLRNPSLHRFFSIPNLVGLTHILLSEQSWLEVVRETHVPNLFLLPSGVIPANPSEILASTRMASLMKDLRENFDIILFDTPPILAVTDGLILSSLCDGVFIVINSGKTKNGLAQKMLKSLEHVKANVIGAVINNKKTSNRKLNSPYYS